ncbi:MAG: hypothetical protein OEW19_03670 [Acidobacteriota bacterium]|nr:hypothetical protein [Acidobacteriota bacterium]
MKRIVLIALGVLLVASGAFAQTPEQTIENALMAAPANMKADATVVKWKADFTYETLKKGTNRLVCYEQSGEPGEQPFSAQCTSIANLDRVAQNRKFEVEQDRPTRQKAIAASEADGTRVKPEFGSVWRSVSGPDKDHVRTHITIAVPGATAASLGLPDNNKEGGAWIMNAGTSTAHIMVPGS